MNSNEIKDSLLKWYYPKGKKIAVTNFGAAGLHEADVIMISKTKMVYEYEVKCSRSDFKADFKKTHKHDLLKSNEYREWYFDKYNDNGWFSCPNYFSYVCEAELIKLEEIPHYAGLIWIEGKNVKVIKKAPKLHKIPATDRLMNSITQNLTAKMIYGCSYMNYKKGK